METTPARARGPMSDQEPNTVPSLLNPEPERVTGCIQTSKLCDWLFVPAMHSGNHGCFPSAQSLMSVGLLESNYRPSSYVSAETRADFYFWTRGRLSRRRLLLAAAAAAFSSPPDPDLLFDVTSLHLRLCTRQAHA